MKIERQTKPFSYDMATNLGEEKPALLLLKIDIVSHPTRAETY